MSIICVYLLFNHKSNMNPIKQIINHINYLFTNKLTEKNKLHIKYKELFKQVNQAKENYEKFSEKVADNCYTLCYLIKN